LRQRALAPQLKRDPLDGGSVGIARDFMRTGFLLVLLLSLSSARVPGQTTIQAFGGDTFRLNLPVGYRLVGQGSPGAGMMAFGFATNQRPDGTRGLIQVTLVDLDKLSTKPPPTLEEFAASMIGGIRQRRNHWQQSESSVDVDGVHTKRIKWSGTNEPSLERPSQQAVSAMHGVMVVGIKGTVAFTLHAQDVEPFAVSSLPASENALMSFTLTPHR